MSTIYPFYQHPQSTIQHHRSPCYALREPEQCYNGYIDDPLDPIQQHAKDLERILNFRLIDDDFMSVVFEDYPCVNLLLRIILERPDLAAHSVKCQNWIKNLQGRSVCLDILAMDSAGTNYNVEVQRADAGAGARRARYHSSLIDANIVEPGDRYQNIHENYVIFITENDVIGDGRPIYHIDRTIRETGKEFCDGSHIIYVNSRIQDDSALGRLMHDFWCKNHTDMYYRELAERVRYFKTDKEGISSMCKAIEDMRNEVAEAKTIQFALVMLSNGEPNEKVARYTGLTLEEVQALADRQPA